MKKLIAGIAAFSALVAGAFEGVDSMHLRIAKESRESVCLCLLAKGLPVSCQLIDPIPVEWSGFFVQCGDERTSACYHHRQQKIRVAEMGGEIGQAFWRSTDQLARSLRHEYVHALLDVSGLPMIENNDPLMLECEK